MKFKIIDCIKRGFGFYKWDVILISWISLVHFSLGYGVKVIYVLSVFFGLKLLFCFSRFFLQFDNFNIIIDRVYIFPCRYYLRLP